MEGGELTGFLREACSEINNGFPNEEGPPRGCDMHCASWEEEWGNGRGGGGGGGSDVLDGWMDGWMDGWGCARIEWRYGQTGRFNDDRTDDSREMR